MNTSKDLIRSVGAAVLQVPLSDQMRAYGSRTVSFVFVRISDHDGNVGTGCTYTLDLGAPAVRAMVSDVLGPHVEGTGLSRWSETYTTLSQRTRRLGRAVFVPAISALDIAAWDLRGIRAGMPIYELLGRAATQVPIYGSGRSSNTLTAEQLVEGTCSYLADGYTSVKLRVGARAAEDDLIRVAQVRDEVGDHVRLMVDCNEQLDVASATRFASGLAALGVYWIEEPFAAEDILAHAQLARQSQVAVAAGEHLVGRHEFAAYIREQAASIMQPDAALTGGITEALRVAALAEGHGLPVSFHSLPELHVHLAMGDPNVAYVEHFPILDPLLLNTLTPSAGQVTAPPTPGHGINWNEDAIAASSIKP